MLRGRRLRESTCQREQTIRQNDNCTVSFYSNININNSRVVITVLTQSGSSWSPLFLDCVPRVCLLAGDQCDRLWVISELLILDHCSIASADWASLSLGEMGFGSLAVVQSEYSSINKGWQSVDNLYYSNIRLSIRIGHKLLGAKVNISKYHNKNAKHWKRKAKQTNQDWFKYYSWCGYPGWFNLSLAEICTVQLSMNDVRESSKNSAKHYD